MSPGLAHHVPPGPTILSGFKRSSSEIEIPARAAILPIPSPASTVMVEPSPASDEVVVSVLESVVLSDVVLSSLVVEEEETALLALLAL
jgi:hypothetical protein